MFSIYSCIDIMDFDKDFEIKIKRYNYPSLRMAALNLKHTKFSLYIVSFSARLFFVEYCYIIIIIVYATTNSEYSIQKFIEVVFRKDFAHLHAKEEKLFKFFIN